MADLIISKSKTKASVKDCNISGDFYTALDAKVRELIAAAEKRAVENGRKTVRPCDI
jgi:histone H3/H4